MDQTSKPFGQPLAALAPFNPSQDKVPDSTIVKVGGKNDREKPPVSTVYAANLNPVSVTSAPVLTSAGASGIVSTVQGASSIAPKESPAARPANSKLFCHERRALNELLAAIESGNCSATALAITPYALNDEEMKRLAKALSVAGKKFADITLVTTGLGKEGFEALAALLDENRELGALHIIDYNGDDERPWKSLADALAHNETLESLAIHFSGSDRGLNERKSLYQALAYNGGLRKVTFQSSHMDSEASSILASSLRANPRIARLDLSLTSFEMGLKHTTLMNAIASHPGLTQASLGASLSQDDLYDLMTGLKNNKVLTKLTVDFRDLSGRPHDSVFVSGAHSMLKANDTLQELCIRNHMLSDAGVWSLSNALAENRTLRKLDLSHTVRVPGPTITELSAGSLSDMLNDNKAIQHIDIDFYEVYENGNWGLASESHPVKKDLRDKLAKNRDHQ